MIRPRNGVGMLAAIMFVGIIATLLAVTLPTIMRYEQLSRVRRTWAILESVRLATANTANAGAGNTYPVFRQRVGTNPSQISQLLGPVTAGDAVNFPDCGGGAFTNAQQNNSRQWAPFLTRTLDTSVGLATPIGVADNPFRRVVLGGGVVAFIVNFDQADLSDILVLDGFDDNDGATAGRIRWDNITGSTARLGYYILSDGAC